MIILGLILSVFAIALFCWLLFTLAVYALPFYVALTSAFWAYHHNAGVLDAILVALLAGFATLATGQIAFAFVRSPIIRGIIALAFAVPATVAGYYATFGLLHIGIANETWCTVFAVIGAILVGATAGTRMAIYLPPPNRPDLVAGLPAPSAPTAHNS